MAVTIIEERPDSPDGLKLLTELDAALWLMPYPPESRHAFTVEKLLQEQVAFFVARLDGTPAACGGLKIFDSEYAEVKRMFVRPAHRGLGLGKAILSHLARHASERQVDLLRLETGIYQTEAIGLYERWGFARRPPFGEYREDPLSVYFEKRLAKSNSKSAIIIRDATSADATAINRLCVEAFEEFQSVVGKSHWKQLRETLERTSELLSKGELIVAEDSSGLLGVVLYVPYGRTRQRPGGAMCAVANAGRFSVESRTRYRTTSHSGMYRPCPQ